MASRWLVSLPGPSTDEDGLGDSRLVEVPVPMPQIGDHGVDAMSPVSADTIHLDLDTPSMLKHHLIDRIEVVLTPDEIFLAGEKTRSHKPLDFGTMFSGTDSIVHLKSMIYDIMKEKFDVHSNVQAVNHMWSSDTADHSRKFIVHNHNPQRLFLNAEMCCATHGLDFISGAWHVVAEPLEVAASWECVNSSTMNVHWSDPSVSLACDNRGTRSGRTFGIWNEYLEIKKPIIFVSEMVRSIANHRNANSAVGLQPGDTDLDFIQNKWVGYGYAVGMVKVDPHKSCKVPNTRARCHFLAVHADKYCRRMHIPATNAEDWCRQQMTKALGLMERLEVDPFAKPIQEFLLPDDHPLVVRETENRRLLYLKRLEYQEGRKRRRLVRDPREQKWVQLHQTMYHNAGFDFVHPDDMATPARYVNNYWFLTKTPRKKSMIVFYDLLHPQADMDDKVTEATLDVSQALDRVKLRLNSASCFTKEDEQFLIFKKRDLLGVEKLRLCGYSHFDWMAVQDQDACKLAGNAISLFTMSSVLLAEYVYFPLQ